MDTLAKSAESAIVNAYNAGDKKGTFAVKVAKLSRNYKHASRF